MSSDFYTNSIVPYQGIIIKICRAYTNSQEDFEDFYQEVCLQIWKSRTNFKGKAAWSTWVYRISLNVCLSLQKKQHVLNSQFSQVENIPDLGNITQTSFSTPSLNKLYAAIRQLSETDKAVIILYLEEKPYQEIAAILGTNANNIGVRVKRIKERLKKILIKTHRNEHIN